MQATIEQHPWNTSFEWEVPSGPFRVLTDAQAEQFSELGFVVLEDVLDLALIDEVREDLDAFEARTESFLGGLEDGRFSIAESGAITFTTHLVTRSPIARAFSANPVFVDLCADLI